MYSLLSIPIASSNNDSKYGPVPNIPNISNILTNIGHRFGHQSGLYESSAQNSAAILIAYSFRVYLLFSKICINCKYHKKKHGFVKKRTCLEKRCRFKTKKKRLRQACSAVNRAWGYQYILKCKQKHVRFTIIFYCY